MPFPTSMQAPKYSSLGNAEGEDDDCIDSSALEPPRVSIRTKLFPYSIALNILLVAILAITWVFSSRQSREAFIPGEIFSPAGSAVEYENVVFRSGLHGDMTEYQGWSDDVNARWDDLYNHIGISQIPADLAAQLPIATTPTASDPSQFMMQLDVFHQLHCLNMLRKLVYPEKFPIDLTSSSPEAEDAVYHHEHCYEQLRQSLQCSSDVSTITWEWSPKNGKMMGNLQTVHTCRNFDKIRDWAKEHRLQEDYDGFRYIPGAPIRKTG